MRAVICVANVAYGVGKSTTAVSLAAELAGEVMLRLGVAAPACMHGG